MALGEHRGILNMSLAVVGIIVSGLAVVLASICLFYTWRLQQRGRQTTPDTEELVRQLQGHPVPEALEQILAHVQDLSRRLGELEDASVRLHTRLRTTVQKVGLVRFNVDESIRGDLSFALALLDAGESGFILTSLCSLEGCRIFIREMQAGETQHDLLPEEQLALARACGLGEE